MSKKTVFTTIGVLVGLGAIAAGFILFPQYSRSSKLENKLKEVATELNQQTPMRVDAMTRLDSASAYDSHFVYHYTLDAVQKSDVQLDTIRKYIEPDIVQKVANSEDLRSFRKYDVTFDYRYYDMNGEFITEFLIGPDRYKDLED